jgi:hypothetical protein
MPNTPKNEPTARTTGHESTPIMNKGGAGRPRSEVRRTHAGAVNEKPGALVPQSHGGALRHGSTPGTNKGGSGRPRSDLRRAYLGVVTELGASLVHDIASGEPLVKMRFAVAALTPYLACANCGETQIRPKDADSYFAEIEVQTSASPRDRIAALEHAAKYGLGALKEATIEEVTERLDRTLDILQANTTPELFATLVRLIEPEWR